MVRHRHDGPCINDNDEPQSQLSTVVIDGVEKRLFSASVNPNELKRGNYRIALYLSEDKSEALILRANAKQHDGKTIDLTKKETNYSEEGPAYWSVAYYNPAFERSFEGSGSPDEYNYVLFESGTLYLQRTGDTPEFEIRLENGSISDYFHGDGKKHTIGLSYKGKADGEPLLPGLKSNHLIINDIQPIKTTDILLNIQAMSNAKIGFYIEDKHNGNVVNRITIEFPLHLLGSEIDLSKKAAAGEKAYLDMQYNKYINPSEWFWMNTSPGADIGNTTPGAGSYCAVTLLTPREELDKLFAAVMNGKDRTGIVRPKFGIAFSFTVKSKDGKKTYAIEGNHTSEF